MPRRHTAYSILTSHVQSTRRILFSSALVFLAAVLVHCTPDKEDHLPRVDQWQLFHSASQEWLPVQVPGDVVTDLLLQGRLKDPFFGTREDSTQWIEHQEWRYRTFVTAPSASHSQGYRLRFEGIDTYASLFIDDSLALTTDNAHRQYVVQLPNSDEGWQVEVVLHSPVATGQAILDHQPRLIPVSNEAKPIGQQTSSVTRKPGYHYGWDWGPRLTSCGISGNVLLEPNDQPLATENRIQLHWLSENQVRIAWETDRLWPRGKWSLITPAMDTLLVQPGNRPTEFSALVTNPKRWWPAGMGDQPLYQLQWTPESTAHRPVRWTVGLRELHWERKADQWGHSFRCTVNGIPVQARGANIIPADFFPVRGEARQRAMLQSAVDANMNMLRVWGGAVYPNDDLLHFCDSAGLFIWQDFMFACAMVPEDSAYIQSVAAEADYQVRRLRNHPCLALWCGNNESLKAWKSWGWQDSFDLHGEDSVATELAYNAVFHGLLPDAVSEHADHMYWASSPMHDPRAEEGAELNSGDEHAWRVWFDTLDFGYYSEHPGRFASEYGLQSLPDATTLAAAGISTFEDQALQFRQRSKMEWLQPGLDGWGMMRIYARRYTADPTAEDVMHTPLERWIYLSQLTQALGLREALERHRTSDGRYAGSLYWQLNDVWPAVSWSTVDHSGNWKLAHYAAKKANRPRCILPVRGASMQGLKAFNDTPEALTGTRLHVAAISLRGDTLSSQSFHVELASFDQAALDGLAWPAEAAVVRWRWQDENGSLIDEGYEVLGKPSQWDWPRADISASIQDTLVVLETDSIAFGVRLQWPGAHFGENGFILFPGDPLTVPFRKADGQGRASTPLRIEHFAAFQ